MSHDCSFLALQFFKENGKYIQENKLRVALISHLHPPPPENRTLRQEPAHDIPDLAEISIATNGILKHEPAEEVPILIETSISNSGALKQELDHEREMSKETCYFSDQTLGGVADVTPSLVRDLLPCMFSVSVAASFFVGKLTSDSVNICTFNLY